MARLRPVPDSPPRAVAYIRVSETREEGISPEIQMAAIEDHCARCGYVLVDTITDLDLTGRFWKRRRVEQAIAMIERHEADVLVVWKISRVARNRLDWAIAVDRVESIGGRLDSATEPMDPSTSTGRLARGMLAEFAAYESDRIGDVWKEVHARRVRSGRPTDGKPRFGYELVDGLHRPDPKHAPILAEMYRRYIAGESFGGIAAWLNVSGVQSSAIYVGQPDAYWTGMSVRRYLDRGFGAGLITIHDEQLPGIHEPVITPATWKSYQAARRARASRRRGDSSPYVLSGLVRCSCGKAMGSAGPSRPGRTSYMKCVKVNPGIPHPAGGRYVRLEQLEARLLEWLTEQATDVNAAAGAAAAQKARVVRSREDARMLRRELGKLDRALTRLITDRAKDRTMPLPVYESARDALLIEREQIEAQLRTAEVESNAGREPFRKIAADLVANWEVYPVEHRRELLRRGLRYLVVTRGDGRTATVDVVAAWEPPRF